MWDIIIFLASVIALLVLLELLALPDWIGQKLRRQMSKNEMEAKIRSIEARISELEKKVSDKR